MNKKIKLEICDNGEFSIIVKDENSAILDSLELKDNIIRLDEFYCILNYTPGDLYSIDDNDLIEDNNVAGELFSLLSNVCEKINDISNDYLDSVSGE